MSEQPPADHPARNLLALADDLRDHPSDYAAISREMRDLAMKAARAFTCMSVETLASGLHLHRLLADCTPDGLMCPCCFKAAETMWGWGRVVSLPPSAAMHSTDAAWPGFGGLGRPGENRVINGQNCRFIERELEGDKWEVLGAADQGVGK